MPTVYKHVPATILRGSTRGRTKAYERIMTLIGQAMRQGRAVEVETCTDQAVISEAIPYPENRVVETISASIETEAEFALREAAE